MRIKVKEMETAASSMLVVLNTEDAKDIGVKDNDRVYIRSRTPKVSMVAVTERFLEPGTAMISRELMKRCELRDGDEVDIVISTNPISSDYIRKKMSGEQLTAEEIEAITMDVASNRLSVVEQAAWLTALHTVGMTLQEIADYAKAMVKSGDRISFNRSAVFDFHSLGGVPGNKITPIVVSIVAAAGVLIPKMSSRAISSACATADFVETFTEVDLTADKLKDVAEKVGGTFAWGGSMNLVPVDDILIKVEHHLGINPRAQMLASIMSKKMAIGATHMLVDIPCGKKTKVPSEDIAKGYARDLMDLGEMLGIHVECAVTYADQPVGYAIGPRLEARECVRILEGSKHPDSVIEKACELAGMVLEMAGDQHGVETARRILESGEAYKKFMEIAKAQGGAEFKADDLLPGEFSEDFMAVRQGYIRSIDNKHLVNIAKLAGAPYDKGAGILLKRKNGQRVDRGDVLFTIYADNKAKLQAAREYALRNPPYDTEGMVVKRIVNRMS